MRRLSAAVVVAVAALLASPRAGAAIVFIPSSAQARVDSFLDVSAIDHLFVGVNSFPSAPHFAVSNADGSASSSVSAVLDQSGFTLNFEQATPGFPGAYLAACFGFTTTVDASYAISGTYATTAAAGPGVVTANLDAVLRREDDNDDETTIYEDGHLGRAGDTLNLIPGEGILLANVLYELRVNAGLNSNIDPTGVGSFNIAFGPAVPEPATATPLAVTAVAALARRRVRAWSSAC